MITSIKSKVFQKQQGFSLVEVVLAIGIFLVSILALVGLLGPTLQSVEDVEDTDEVASIVSALNAFLNKSPTIAQANQTKFQTIYGAVAPDGYAQMFAYRAYRNATSTDIVLKIGFADTEPVNSNAQLTASDFDDAAGPIYRIVLSPSSVMPIQYYSSTEVDDDGNDVPARSAGTDTYIMAGSVSNDVTAYLEGYFAMEVRIYNENPGPRFDPSKVPPTYDQDFSLNRIREIEPIFTYNTAIVRSF